jgi:hypothetical protein
MYEILGTMILYIKEKQEMRETGVYFHSARSPARFPVLKLRTVSRFIVVLALQGPPLNVVVIMVCCRLAERIGSDSIDNLKNSPSESIPSPPVYLMMLSPS